MKYFSLAALVLLLPATLARSVHPAAAHTHSHDGDDYGKGGRYGFKSCTDRGLRPGRVSCLNVSSLLPPASTHTHTLANTATIVRLD